MSAAISAASARGESLRHDQEHEHQQQQSHRPYMQDEHNLEEDGDDVFSNPDTAELESSRSDATGATSPAPNSPGPSSPSNRGTSHIAIITSQHPDPLSTLTQQQQNEYSNAIGGSKKTPPTTLALASLPSANIAHMQHQFEKNVNVETPRPSGSTPLASTRPQFGRTLSASGATMHHTQPPMVSSAGNSRVSTPRIRGHASSHSTSYLNLSLAPGQPLPSAHDMPSDPREASTLSKLFARPPAQSPTDELIGFRLGSSPITLADGSGMALRSGSSSVMASPATPLASMSPLTPTRLRSRPGSRPASPEHPHRLSNAGLGLTAYNPRAHGESEASEPSIFERDIEHRDAGHVLSQQEAIDVAIPSVLDDAVEAITCEDADHLEIVAPHAVMPPLALSAQALSAHSHSHNSLQGNQISSASSPAHSPSPPLSSSGAVEAPAGSMAAQIAERLASRTGSIAPDEAVSTSPSGHGLASRHRRPNSDVSVSSSSSMRSRSPQVPLSIGVQQVLDASRSSAPSATPGPRSVSASPAAHHSKSASLTPAPRSAGGHAGCTSQAASPKPSSPLPTATALPSLPLPNPFRSHSPPSSLSPLADGGMPMVSSVSMDGAVMTTSDSATMDASLDGLADVFAASQPTSRIHTNCSSPVTKTRGLGFIDDDVGPYSSRSPAMTYSATTSPQLSKVTSSEKGMAGGLAMGGGISASMEDSLLASPRTTKSSTSSVAVKKRLSFFSYADIINHTPAEVLDFDAAIRQADEAVLNPSHSSLMSRSVSGGPNVVLGEK